MDHEMTSPSRARRKAKEDAEHAALNALLEQGKSPDRKSFFFFLNYKIIYLNKKKRLKKLKKLH